MDLSQKSLEELRDLEVGVFSGKVRINPPEARDKFVFQLHQLMARRAFPGPVYTEWLEHLHKFLKVKNYLEIGVANGKTLGLAQQNTKAVGVDPAFTLTNSLQAATRLYRLTSDAFFEQFTDTYRGRFDFVFIDGLHTAEQTLQDFVNVLPALTEDAIVVFHDVLPVSEMTATKDRQTHFWTGDVWRILGPLQNDAMSWSQCVIPTFPSGLLVLYNIKKRDEINGKALFASLKSVPANEIPKTEGDASENFIPNEFAAIEPILSRFRS